MEKENKKDEFKVDVFVEKLKAELPIEDIENINKLISPELTKTIEAFQKEVSLKVASIVEAIDFSPIVKSFNLVTDSLRKMLEQIDLSKLPTEKDMEPLKIIDLYMEQFEEKQIVIDKEFYAFIKERYSDEFSSDVNKEEDWQENLLIEYLDQRINNKSLNFNVAEKNEQNKILVDSLLLTLEQENWIAAAFLLHTFIEIIAKTVLKDFEEKELSFLREIAEIDQSKNLGESPKKCRILFASAVDKVDVIGYQMNEASIADAFHLCPYVATSLALNFYDSLPKEISRNYLIHFNRNVQYNKIDKFHIYQLIQTAKVLEQQATLDKTFILPVLEGIKEFQLCRD